MSTTRERRPLLARVRHPLAPLPPYRGKESNRAREQGGCLPARETCTLAHRLLRHLMLRDTSNRVAALHARLDALTRDLDQLRNHHEANRADQ